MKTPKCKVVIKCDNKIMQEFGMVEIQDKNPKVVQCSIPSEPGKVSTIYLVGNFQGINLTHPTKT